MTVQCQGKLPCLCNPCKGEREVDQGACSTSQTGPRLETVISHQASLMHSTPPSYSAEKVKLISNHSWSSPGILRLPSCFQADWRQPLSYCPCMMTSLSLSNIPNSNIFLGCWLSPTFLTFFQLIEFQVLWEVAEGTEVCL